MVRTVLTPENTHIELDIPVEYVGREIEVTFLALDEFDAKREKKTMADFLGILSDRSAKELQDNIKKSRKRVGERYLIDPNVIIDFLNYSLPEDGIKLLLNIKPNISIITRIEIFGKSSLSTLEIINLKEFIKFLNVYVLDEAIALKTIGIRSIHKIKLPDAIIAATAILHNLILLTRNTSDFNKVLGLKVADPYSI